MNARRVRAAESVVLAALKGRQTAAGIAAALDAAGLLQLSETAAELVRLRSLMDAKPLDLTEEQRDALSDAGNRALNDHYHDDLCHCREWPTSCVTSGYFPGMWDTGAFDIGLGAVLGLWESMRADAASARVAELEAERHSTNEALSEAAEQLRVQRDRIDELEALPTVAAVLDAAADAIVADNDRQLWASNPGKHWAADLLRRMAKDSAKPRPSEGALAEQRHLVDELDHALEALAPRDLPEVAS